MSRQRIASGIARTSAVLAAWLLAGAVQAETVEYIHTDALGSVVAVTDANRNVIERREYEPYGHQLTPTVSNGPGYTGHVQDAATGLVYMQQRYYWAEGGRFLSVDPVTADPNSGGLFNRYLYAANNPYRFFDPDGRCTGSRIENRDGTCKSTGDFTTMGKGPTMPGAETVIHEASIRAQSTYSSQHAIAECRACVEQDHMQRAAMAGRISHEELNQYYKSQAKGALIGLGGVGGALSARVAVGIGAAAWKNISFDGPSAGLAYAQGRVFGVRWKGGHFVIRLDLHSRKPGGPPVLHVNYGSPKGAENNHVDLWTFGDD